MPDSNPCDRCQDTPAEIKNLPGQVALAYRIRTHSQFKAAMLAAISGQAALSNFTTRDDDDASIALIDAWATTLDVLTFYQERLANEGYLRTSTERLSILELARSIGYELRPGVAASTYLAFDLEAVTAGAPEKVVLPIGTKAQTIPGQDELPQTFETVEAIEARPEWNRLKAKVTVPSKPEFGDQKIYLEGTNTQLKPGDGLLIVGKEREDDPANERWDFRRVSKVTPNPAANITLVEWDKGLGKEGKHGKQDRVLPAEQEVKVYAFRQRAALFGYNAPDWRMMSDDIRGEYGDPNDDDWPNLTIDGVADSTHNDSIFLDNLYSQVVPESWLILATPIYQEVYKVVTVAEDSRQNFALTTKTTCITLRGENLYEKFNNRLRETVVYAASDKLSIAEEPDSSPINRGSHAIMVQGNVTGLSKGRMLIVAGLEAESGKLIAEMVKLEEIKSDETGTCLVFQSNLLYSYKRDSAVIHANVAAATHGETKIEVLGSGDASQPFQKFGLKQTPLTYTATDQTPSGAITTLALRVNEVLWQEASSLYGLGKRDRRYITRIGDDGKVLVMFGDGASGARLPTGAENVQATYRVGTGLAGMVKANQISLLMTRPLGAKGVTNPMAPEGAQDSETRDGARQNAPLTVLTLDRVVSLQDFEDFARAFSGIGKAQAVWLWDGERHIVHLTVAAANGGPVPANSALRQNLRKAITAACDPTQQFQIDSYIPLTFTLVVKVKVKAEYLADKVLAAITAALRQVFVFEKRAFGQPVTVSDVIALVQSLEGVVFVDLDSLTCVERRAMKPPLVAQIAHWENKVIKPAELLTLNAALNSLQVIPIP